MQKSTPSCPFFHVRDNEKSALSMNCGVCEWYINTECIKKSELINWINWFYSE